METKIDGSELTLNPSELNGAGLGEVLCRGFHVVTKTARCHLELALEGAGDVGQRELAVDQLPDGCRREIQRQVVWLPRDLQNDAVSGPCPCDVLPAAGDQILELVLEGGKTFTDANRIYSTPGGDMILAVELTPLRDQQAQVIGALQVSEDVTEQVRLEDELRAAELVAERLEVSEDELPAHGVRIFSSGTAALTGDPATPPAVDAAAKWGADITGHVAQPLTPTTIRESDLIVTATRYHAEVILTFAPEAARKVRPMRRDGRDVRDPYGKPDRVYRKVAAEIREEMAHLAEEVAGIGRDEESQRSGRRPDLL